MVLRDFERAVFGTHERVSTIAARFSVLIGEDDIVIVASLQLGEEDQEIVGDTPDITHGSFEICFTRPSTARLIRRSANGLQTI